MALFPNGDWRSRQIEFYVPPGSRWATAQRDDVVNHVASGLQVAIASNSPHLYNRSKWTGADLAVDDVGDPGVCASFAEHILCEVCSTI